MVQLLRHHRDEVTAPADAAKPLPRDTRPRASVISSSAFVTRSSRSFSCRSPGPRPRLARRIGRRRSSRDAIGIAVRPRAVAAGAGDRAGVHPPRRAEPSGLDDLAGRHRPLRPLPQPALSGQPVLVAGLPIIHNGWAIISRVPFFVLTYGSIVAAEEQYLTDDSATLPRLPRAGPEMVAVAARPLQYTAEH